MKSPKWLACIFILLTYSSALAVPLDTWPTWSAAQPFVSKQVPPYALVARCRGANSLCVVEVDQTTGELPVTLSGGGIVVDYSGPTGAPVPGSAAYVAGIDGSGDLQGLSVDSSGILNVNVTGSSGTSDVHVTNLPATVAVDHGATDASTLRTSEGSRTYSDSVRYDYTGGTVTTAAWTQIAAATLIAMNYVCITDQSGQIIYLGTGGVGAETPVFMIARGFSGCIPLRIAAATRLSLKAVSASASTGDFVLSGMN